MTAISRRSFLGNTALAAAALTAGCAISKNGNVTTATLNVKAVDSYGTAILNFAQAAVVIPFVATAIGAPALVIVNAAIATLKEGLTAFDTASGGSATVSFDNTSVATAFDSILASAKTINGYIVATIQATVSDSTVVAEAKSAASAASGIISIIEGLVASVGAPVNSQVGAALRGDGYVATIDQWCKAQSR